MKKYLFDEIKKHYCILKENVFKKHFPKEYDEICNWIFPSDFSFKQKVYHYINDDIGLNLGLCKTCRNRTTLKNITYGYHLYCGLSCLGKSEEIKKKKETTSLKKYGSEHFSKTEIYKNSIKNTNIKKYGVENVFQSEKIKNKIKETNLARYGVDNPNKSCKIREKTKNTNIERYGGNTPMSSEKVRQKVKCTNIKKYGVNAPTKNKNVLEKRKNNNLIKYGVENPSSLESIRNKVKSTNIERYGVSNTFLIKKSVEKNKKTTSKAENEIFDFIKNIYDGTVLKRDRVVLEGLEIDILLPELNIGFEYNGDYWHMNPNKYKENCFNTSTKRYAFEQWEYDKNKIDKAAQKNITIITIWEHEWLNETETVKRKIHKLVKNENIKCKPIYF